MSELRAMAPVTGTAEHFRQVLQPHDAAIVPMTSFVARGTLDHGGPFHVHGLFIEGVTVMTQITGLPPLP